MFCMFGLGAGR